MKTQTNGKLTKPLPKKSTDLQENILKKIYNSSLRFLNPLDLEETYRLIVEEAMKLVGAQSGSIILGTPSDKLERVYSSSAKLNKIQLRPEGYTYKVYKTHRAVVLTRKDISKIHPEVKITNITSDLILPLSYRSKSVGVLTVQSGTRDFTENDLRILTLFNTVASLAIRKNQMYEEITEALKTRDLFISMASHELRTPLTTINGYVQLLQGSTKHGETESRWIEELSWETYRLTQLVKELLEVNRIRQGQLDYHWKECSFVELINRAIKSFSMSHPKHKVVFKNNLKKESDKLIGDFDKLLQVLTNLLDNSAKFSPPSSEVTLSLTARGGDLILKVVDKGSGIASEELSKIFENYYRGSNHQREGLGVGLYLAKYIIERHRGEIFIKSKQNKGTTVEIRIPQVK